MTPPAANAPVVPRLTDRAARYFGVAGRIFATRASLPAEGSLVLTEDALTYVETGTGMKVEIPLEEIQSLGIGGWHEATGSYLPVLKITYRRNLVFGVHVAEPRLWVEAVDDLTARGRLPQLHRADLGARRIPRGVRLLVAVFLVVVLALGALPQALSRLASRGPASLAGPPVPAHDAR